MDWEWRSPVELPLWGNITVLIVVVFMVGWIASDLYKVFKDKEKK